jgi:hypothetical protein
MSSGYLIDLFKEAVKVLEPHLRALLFDTEATVIATDENFKFVKHMRDPLAQVRPDACAALRRCSTARCCCVPCWRFMQVLCLAFHA